MGPAPMEGIERTNVVVVRGSECYGLKSLGLDKRTTLVLE